MSNNQKINLFLRSFFNLIILAVFGAVSGVIAVLLCAILLRARGETFFLVILGPMGGASGALISTGLAYMLGAKTILGKVTVSIVGGALGGFFTYFLLLFVIEYLLAIS